MSLPKWAEQALNTQESQIEKLEARIKTLVTELRAANVVIADYRKLHADAEAEIQKLQQEVQAAVKMCEERQAEIVRLNHLVAKLEANQSDKLIALNDYAYNLDQQLEWANAEIQKLRSALQEAQKIDEEQTREISRLNASIEAKQ